MDNKTEFKILIEKYLNLESTLEEEKRLFSYYDALQKHKEWDNNLMGDEDSVRKIIFSNIINEIETKEKPVKTIKTAWLAIAASLVILFSIGIFVYQSKKDSSLPLNKEATALHQNDILPGGNKATLTLSDGTRILLDDATNGELARQKNIIIKKTGDGQLVYDLSQYEDDGAGSKLNINTISTPVGGQYQLILPDGSKVWLNSLSSLRFPVVFKDKTRRVELSGEGYFEIAKDRNKPFIVKVGGTEVEVLGTHFNIMAYKDELNNETTLLEGSVKVKSLASSQSIVLIPGQQAQIQTGSSDLIKVKEVNTAEITAWKDGYFQFNREDIQSVMKDIVRWYDVEVVYEGDIPQEQFVGRIRRSVTLSQVLKILEYSKVNFRIDGRKIIIRK